MDISGIKHIGDIRPRLDGRYRGFSVEKVDSQPFLISNSIRLAARNTDRTTASWALPDPALALDYPTRQQLRGCCRFSGDIP